jgi:hypothetical protein
MELFSCCVDFMILEADNLSAVFPHARLSIGAFHLTAKQVRSMPSALLWIVCCMVFTASVKHWPSALLQGVARMTAASAPAALLPI